MLRIYFDVSALHWQQQSHVITLLSVTQGGQLTPIDLVVEQHFHRAAPGGMGGTKAAGNYSPVGLFQLHCVLRLLL